MNHNVGNSVRLFCKIGFLYWVPKSFASQIKSKRTHFYCIIISELRINNTIRSSRLTIENKMKRKLMTIVVNMFDLWVAMNCIIVCSIETFQPVNFDSIEQKEEQKARERKSEWGREWVKLKLMVNAHLQTITTYCSISMN